MLESIKQKLCKILGLFYFEIKIGESIEKIFRELKKLSLIQKIIGDGNCYFRVIFYCFIRLESYYNVICIVVCKYILRYENDFKMFLRFSDFII